VSRRNLLASLLVACAPLVAFLGATPSATGASAGKRGLELDKSARTYVLKRKSKGRVRSTKIHLPVGPSYIYYDYPYYYARGYYPTHIGGYVYYPYYYYYGSSRYRGPVALRSQKPRGKR
jgi:hypothetical protein